MSGSDLSIRDLIAEREKREFSVMMQSRSKTSQSPARSPSISRAVSRSGSRSNSRSNSLSSPKKPRIMNELSHKSYQSIVLNRPRSPSYRKGKGKGKEREIEAQELQESVRKLMSRRNSLSRRRLSSTAAVPLGDLTGEENSSTSQLFSLKKEIFYTPAQNDDGRAQTQVQWCRP